MQHLNEAKLIELAKNYDEQALSELYRRHANDIFRYIFYRVGHQATAEDLVADVFVKALEGLADYEDRGKPFQAWLYRIAHARVIDHYRRQNVRQTVALDERLTSGDEADPDVMATLHYDIHQMWQAMIDLTSDQQEVLTLRFMMGYAIAEVAEIMNKTEGAVKALQHRGLAALRRLLETER